MKYLRIAVALFFMPNSIVPYLVHQNEVLCITAAQGDTRILEEKFDNEKKILKA